MYVCKNKSTNWNYIWCFVSVWQVATDLGEHITSISKVTYMNGTSIFTLQNKQQNGTLIYHAIDICASNQYAPQIPHA